MTLFILPSVDAQFDLSVEGLTYKLTGPAKLTSLLEDATDGEALEGTISPLTAVTVPDAVKSSVSIPLAASWFAFLYPIKRLAPKRALRSNDAAFGFLLGGFLYFDANRSLVGFNASGLVRKYLSGEQLDAEEIKSIETDFDFSNLNYRTMWFRMMRKRPSFFVAAMVLQIISIFQVTGFMPSTRVMARANSPRSMTPSAFSSHAWKSAAAIP